MNIKDIKITLPSSWKEASRNGNDRQVIIQLFHISPLVNISEKKFKSELILDTPTETILTVPINVPTGVGVPMGKIRKSMPVLRKQIPGAESPDESDMTGNITIVKYDTKEMAQQAFDNYNIMPTAGFFNTNVIGRKDMTYMDFLKSDEMKSHLTPEQIKASEELTKVMKEQEPKIQQELKESGIKYGKEKYLGYDAVFSEMPNTTKPPAKKIAQKSKSGGMGGGYGNGAYDPLPKIEEPYSQYIKTYQAILINNYVVTGQLVGMPALLPSANTPCYSLTKTKENTVQIGNIKTTYITPTVSTYSAEGYMNKEDTENTLKNILKAVSAL